ncbi:MAG: hypothetical protein ACK55Z_35310, partial [bacterium]
MHLLHITQVCHFECERKVCASAENRVCHASWRGRSCVLRVLARAIVRATRAGARDLACYARAAR